MVEEKVTILAILEDKFSRPLKKLTGGLGKLFSLITGAGKFLASPFLLLTKGITSLVSSFASLQALLIGGGAAGIIAVFGRFEEQMLQVATLVDTTVVSISKLGDEVRKIAVETGGNFTSLTKGLFDLISAGVEATEATETLRVAAKLAAAGGTSTAEAVDGLTSILNAYELSADNATDVTDSLFKAMEGGKVTIGEIASGIGTIAKSASSTGLSVDELTGSVAVLTKTLKPQIAIQALNSLLASILAPTAGALKAAERFKEFGVELSTAALRSKGLVKFMQEISEATGDVDTAIQSLFPNQRAFRAALILSGEDAKNLALQMEKMAEKAGATDVALKKTSAGLLFQLRQVRNLFLSILVEIGEAAKPFLEEVIGSAQTGKGLAGFLQKIIDSKNQVQAVITGIGDAIKLIANVARTAFNQGDLLTFFVNIVKSALVAVTETLIAGLPLLLTTVAFIGEELARALIKSFIGTTREALVKAAAAGGIGGFAAREIAGLAGVDPTELNRQADAIAKIDAELLKVAKTLALKPEIRRALGFSTAIPSRAGDPLSLRMIELSIPQLQEVIKLANARGLSTVRELLAKKEGIFDNMIGEPAIDETVSRALPLIRIATVGLINSTEEILAKAMGALGDGLKAPTTDAIDTLMNFIKEVLPERFKQAGIADEAAKLGGEAAGAAKKGVKKEKDAAVPTEAEALGEGPQAFDIDQFNEGLRESISLFDDWRTIGAAAGQALTAGVSGAIDVILNANASWSAFARNFLISIAKMILQMAIFRAISSGLTGGGGSTATTAATSTATTTTTTTGLGTNFGSGGTNKGGWASLVGMRAYNAGVDFVPGKRGANVDTVPAYLTVGEAVTQRPSVDYYGRDLMAAINRRLIPRDGIRALMGQMSSGGAAMVQRRFNTGGIAVGSGSTSGGVGPTVLPVMPMSDENVETLLSGGADGVFRFFGDNREQLVTALNINNRDNI